MKICYVDVLLAMHLPINLSRVKVSTIYGVRLMPESIRVEFRMLSATSVKKRH